MPSVIPLRYSHSARQSRATSSRIPAVEHPSAGHPHPRVNPRSGCRHPTKTRLSSRCQRPAIRIPATQTPTIRPPWRKHHPDQTRTGGRLNLRPKTAACPLPPRSGERISEPWDPPIVILLPESTALIPGPASASPSHKPGPIPWFAAVCSPPVTLHMTRVIHSQTRSNSRLN